MSRNERLYVLVSTYGIQYFTNGEKATAMALAKEYHERGWEPWLLSKCWNGQHKVWYDWKENKLPKRRAA
jgi:hypothetical protein